MNCQRKTIRIGLNDIQRVSVPCYRADTLYKFIEISVKLSAKRFGIVEKMKRYKITAAILLAGCLMALCGCQAKVGEEFTEEVDTLEGVSLTVDAGQVTSSGITYTIDNQSEKDLSYGRDYSLQKEKDGKWYRVEPKSAVAVTMELLWIPAGDAQTEALEWEDAYGKLPAGKYRVVKSVSDYESGYYLTGEFNVD